MLLFSWDVFSVKNDPLNTSFCFIVGSFAGDAQLTDDVPAVVRAAPLKSWC